MNNNEKIIKGKEGGSRFAKIAARVAKYTTAALVLLPFSGLALPTP